MVSGFNHFTIDIKDAAFPGTINIEDLFPHLEFDRMCDNEKPLILKISLSIGFSGTITLSYLNQQGQKQFVWTNGTVSVVITSLTDSNNNTFTALVITFE